MIALCYVVPGDPIPKARARVVNGRAHTPARTREYEQKVHLFTVQAVGHARKSGVSWRTDVRYAVELFIVRQTRHQLDIDNVAKAWCDGAQSVLFANDAQIDHLTVHRGAVDAENPRVVAMVLAMSPDQSESHSAKRMVDAHLAACGASSGFIGSGVAP